jgi:hypothetical protein
VPAAPCDIVLKVLQPPAAPELCPTGFACTAPCNQLHVLHCVLPAPQIFGPVQSILKYHTTEEVGAGQLLWSTYRRKQALLMRMRC